MGTIQILQKRLIAYIQRRQLIVGTIQIRQKSQIAYIQLRQLIAVTIQRCQIRQRTYIQRRQRVKGTIQRCQIRLPAYIQLRQRIFVTRQTLKLRQRAYIQLRQPVQGTIQRCQIRQRAYIQRRQQVSAAIQSLQAREILQCRQIGKPLFRDIQRRNRGHRRQILLGQRDCTDSIPRQGDICGRFNHLNEGHIGYIRLRGFAKCRIRQIYRTEITHIPTGDIAILDLTALDMDRVVVAGKGK